MNIEQFKEFPDAISALRLKTVDIALIEILEEKGDDISCHVLVKDNDLAREIKKWFPSYYRVNDANNFPTFFVFEDAAYVKSELSVRLP